MREKVLKLMNPEKATLAVTSWEEFFHKVKKKKNSSQFYIKKRGNKCPNMLNVLNVCNANKN